MAYGTAAEGAAFGPKIDPLIAGGRDTPVFRAPS